MYKIKIIGFVKNEKGTISKGTELIIEEKKALSLIESGGAKLIEIIKDDSDKEDSKVPPKDDSDKEDSKVPPKDDSDKEDSKVPPKDDSDKEDSKEPPKDDSDKEEIKKGLKKTNEGLPKGVL